MTSLFRHFARFFVRRAVILVVLESLVAGDNDKAKRHRFALQVDVGFQIKCRREADEAKVHHGAALVNAHRIAIEEEEFFIDVFKAVVFVVDGPFRGAVVFLTIRATVVVDIAFEACTFLVTLVPFAAKRTGLHTRTAIALLIQLVINDNIIHLQVLDLIIDVHENDVRFDVLGAFAGEIHVLMSFQESLLQINVDGIRDFALFDFVECFLGRHKNDFVTFLDGVTKLVANVIQALLHVNMHGIRTCRNEVCTDAHVPFVGRIFCIFIEFAERILASTIHKNQVDVKFCHERFFFIDGAAQTPKIRIQAEHFGKGLVAIEGG